MDHLRDVPVFSVVIGAYIAWSGLKKKSLSKDGAIAAFLVGTLMLSTELRVFGVTLLVFYFIGSRATKVGKALKAKLEDGVREGAGQRDAVQVLCNSLPAFIACLVWRSLYTHSWFSLAIPSNTYARLYNPHDVCALSQELGGGWSRFLLLVTLGQFGCSLGDTLASELGILSKSKPILVTTLKQVPPGTNGAMSLLGTTVSIVGGGVIGLTMGLVLLLENPACRELGVQPFVTLVLLGLLSGGLGSLIDSILGATVQQTRYSTSTKRILTDDSKPQSGSAISIISGRDFLSNNQVNLVSSAFTALLVAFIG
ncbi:hypothetical protein M408DRAFT_15135 [Serendipita vermifera MAFF 305830]|uniref:Transmembrane protein 19 n=1 Tax=Serendipita vermifera MAFF 305830 TaxID=933852 RepID=A0A0C2WZ37_SERVB|nr:hypothetical protein M408DRAFT_15135 [Serendipita vermifera MAFF 305830]